MPRWLQLKNVAQNRWCGAYWQDKGLTVIPTISWGLSQSFDFCFEGVEKGSVVAVGTVGCRRAKLNFMRGYDKMLEIIQPQAIICYGGRLKRWKAILLIYPILKTERRCYNGR